MLRANQIAKITSDFKMDVIRAFITALRYFIVCRIMVTVNCPASIIVVSTV